MSTGGSEPERFGAYRLDALIGRGGMGEVYRAWDTARHRVVALKRLPASLAKDPDFQERFRTESRLAAQLRSEHVIPIHDYGEIDGQLFIDMRLVEGEDLADRVARTPPLAPPAAVHVVEQVASALDAAHAAGLEHRDVKPSNVLLSTGPGGTGGDAKEHPFAYLVDFGIARAVDGTRGLTGTGQVIGTIAYMAPERFANEPSDHRADVYALAALLYETLVGREPFPTTSAAATVYAHMYTPPPRPSWDRRDVPPALDAVVACGMAKRPADRYPGAGALAAAAREALTRPPTRPPAYSPGFYGPGQHGRTAHGGPAPTAIGPTGYPGPYSPGPPQDGPPIGTRRWWWGVGAAAAALVVALVVVLVLASSTSGPQDVATVPAGSSPVTAAATVRVSQNFPIYSLGGLAVARSGQDFVVGKTTGTTEAGAVEVHAATDGSLRGTIALSGPGSPTAIALSPDGATVYAATATTSLTNAPEQSAVVFADVPGARSVGSVATPDRVEALATSPDGRRLYAAAGSSLLIIDTTTRTVVATVATGQGGLGTSVAVAPDGHEVLVSGSAGVQRVDPVAARVTATIGLRNSPAGIAITPDGTRALAVTSASKSVAVIDLRTGQATSAIPVGDGAGPIVVTPDGTQALVVNKDAASMSVIDLSSSHVSTVSVGSFPDAVALSADGRYGFVTTSSNVVRFDRSG